MSQPEAIALEGKRTLPMFSPDLLRDAQRQLEICNACRYCEGVCAVFPALERRRAFTEGDVAFLAHVCHDCRACYYVCPFVPPHEFGVNIPLLMSQVREETYDHYAWPRRLSRILADRGPGLAVVLAASLTVAVAASLAFAGVEALTTPATGPGAFYRVIPWLWMFLPATLLTLVGLAIVLIGVARYWRDIGASVSDLRAVDPIARGVADALTLKNLDGGGPGCDYPDEIPSSSRRVMHHLVFWGFVAAFISTTLAFIYQDVFGILPPYDLTSLPVLFGTGGGIAMIVGGIGLVVLKAKSDRVPASKVMFAKDSAFLMMLLLLNVTGLLLLAVRETAFMALVLDIHLASVLAFFLTAPYGKLIHGVYRTAALMRDKIERQAEAHPA